MSIDTDDILEQAHELRKHGEPFALATVVRVTRPASARPGAKAIIWPDGTISGWVGGSCAQPLTAREGLRALADGQPRLLCLVGVSGRAPEPAEGLVVEPMTCHSGGTLEIYIEPFVARPRLLIVGQTPVAAALAQMGALLGYDVVAADPDAGPEHFPTANTLLKEVAEIKPLLTPRTYVVVATHGSYDHAALDLALASDAAYVALVASRRRAEALLRELDVSALPADRLAMLRSPAGLDLGGVEAAEIALSILAEIVQTRRSARPAIADSQPAAEQPQTALDPVCGMTVEVATARHVADYQGRRFFFCCDGCRRSFEKDPEGYFAAA